MKLNQKSEKNIIIAACVLVAVISCVLTISQGHIKSNKNDEYISRKVNTNKDVEVKEKLIDIENGKLLKKYYKVENEIEGLPEDYEVKAVEPFDDKTVISIQIPKSNNPDLVLGQVKSIGQKVKDDYLEKGEDLGNLEIKAYYNEENNYWSYSSSNKDIIIHNEIIQN